MSRLRIRKQQLEYQNRYQTILRVDVSFGARRKTIFVDDHGIRIGMIAMRNRKILLVRQDRLLTGGPSLEIPGGRAEAGESLGAAAIRECLEETGYLCSDIEPLVHYMPGMDTVLNPTYIFTAGNLKKIDHPRTDAGEFTHALWLPISTCMRLIEGGQIRCALTITAILMLACRRRKRQGSAS